MLLSLPLLNLLFKLKHDLRRHFNQHFLLAMFRAERFLVVGVVSLLESLLRWTYFPGLPFDGLLF